MTPKISMLSAEAKSEIHGRSLEILEKVGIRFHSRKACQILQEAGCEVDWDKLSARIPRSLAASASGGDAPV
ncbi:MAG: trimethylamine methyltransferase family protein [Deltaproteobacteria bacterium]|nr:trimethylamine methyltransferase family protein [Deltaproteobacteria bacterium]